MTNKKDKMKTTFKAFVLMFLLLAVTVKAAAKTRTVRHMMDIVAREQGVSFVYDATLPLDVPFTKAAPKKHKLDLWLNALFQPIGITWTRQGHYVMLHRKAAAEHGFQAACHLRGQADFRHKYQSPPALRQCLFNQL
jgi:hypothetical protein